MNDYEITMTLDNSYEITKTITSKSEHLAITECRELIKKEYKPTSIWFTNLKKL